MIELTDKYTEKWVHGTAVLIEDDGDKWFCVARLDNGDDVKFYRDRLYRDGTSPSGFDVGCDIWTNYHGVSLKERPRA